MGETMNERFAFSFFSGSRLPVWNFPLGQRSDSHERPKNRLQEEKMNARFLG